MNNPRPSDPDVYTDETSITLSGSCYSVVVIGGKELPEGIAVEEAEQLVNEWGEFPLGQDGEYGLFYWTAAAYIHHPEVEGALQLVERSLHENQWSAFAARDRIVAQLRNPLAVATGVDVAEPMSVAELRALLPSE